MKEPSLNFTSYISWKNQKMRTSHKDQDKTVFWLIVRGIESAVFQGVPFPKMPLIAQGFR